MSLFLGSVGAGRGLVGEDAGGVFAMGQPRTVGEKGNELATAGGSLESGRSDASSGPVSPAWPVRSPEQWFTGTPSCKEIKCPCGKSDPSKAVAGGRRVR